LVRLFAERVHVLRAVDCRLCLGGCYIVIEGVKGALGFSHIPTRISTMGMARSSKLEETLGG
jgi:hypothetical protein